MTIMTEKIIMMRLDKNIVVEDCNNDVKLIFEKIKLLKFKVIQILF